MTSEQIDRIRQATAELQAAMNDAGDTEFRIEHLPLTQHVIGSDRTRYINEIVVTATSELKVFP